MAAPKNSAQVQGQGSVSADNLNTYVQWCTTAAVLRSFIGLPNMNVYLEGISAPNDGLQGYFLWQAVVTGPDDNLNLIIPTGAANGGWVRLSTGGNTVILPTTGNTVGDIVVMSNTTTGIVDSGVPVAKVAQITPITGNVVSNIVVMSNTTTGIVDSGVPIAQVPRLTESAYAPTDQSGAGLTLGSVAVEYTVIGNLVFLTGKLSYPANSDSRAAALSIPFAAGATADAIGSAYCNASTTTCTARISAGTSVMTFLFPTLGALTNANFNGNSMGFSIVYSKV